jgi:hypothetical protein
MSQKNKYFFALICKIFVGIMRKNLAGNCVNSCSTFSIIQFLLS